MKFQTILDLAKKVDKGHLMNIEEQKLFARYFLKNRQSTVGTSKGKNIRETQVSYSSFAEIRFRLLAADDAFFIYRQLHRILDKEIQHNEPYYFMRRVEDIKNILLQYSFTQIFAVIDNKSDLSLGRESEVVHGRSRAKTLVVDKKKLKKTFPSFSDECIDSLENGVNELFLTYRLQLIKIVELRNKFISHIDISRGTKVYDWDLGVNLHKIPIPSTLKISKISRFCRELDDILICHLDGYYGQKSDMEKDGDFRSENLLEAELTSDPW